MTIETLIEKFRNFKLQLQFLLASVAILLVRALKPTLLAIENGCKYEIDEQCILFENEEEEEASRINLIR
ncbi:hypothetical protein T4B_3693 [Trichinella pseudospiralis]|uniref:Uncharacterized protein n=1 Tax=Trichinella pseudospiralis TaxID=6337 RepID=A0A0V1IJT8_TRIPS|nr:hypothetical protein T4B_3693 [Trichinella pseudospiralis]